MQAIRPVQADCLRVPGADARRLAGRRAGLPLAAGADLIDSLLERARAIRARVTAVVEVDLAAVAVTATVFVMNKYGRFHRRHLLAEARRHLAPSSRPRSRPPPRPGPAATL